MNIGLLVSELEDKEVKKICIGASKAARDNKYTLCILPGNYLLSDKNDQYDYQNSAVYDYALKLGLDVLIIDIERIGKDAPILKKEAFLKKIADIPLVTLTKQEGFVSVNDIEEGEYYFEKLGYEAVIDAVYYSKNKTLPQYDSSPEISIAYKDSLESLYNLSKIGHRVLHRKYPSEMAYDAFSKALADEDIKYCSILVYDNKIVNSIKYWWKIPEHITIKTNLCKGSIKQFPKENRVISTNNLLENLTDDEPKVLIAGSIFVGEYQLGLLLIDFVDDMLTDFYFDSLISVATGVTRVSYLEKELKKRNEELYEVQEELARDDSVLDHIGDQDYLTGGLNRRGFFAKAYDLLKENFKPGKYAIVAYIHMESLKGINSLFGHDEGDRAVKKVADILEEVFKGSIYGRIRGDEFAVIEITDEECKAESFREEMSTQNARLLSESNRYINNLLYSICEFSYEDNFSLREMLKETDDNLQKIKENHMI